MILENPIGLWALTAIIVVLILHRLRQRPERKEVSSLLIWKKITRLLTVTPVRQKSRLYLILMLQILAVIALSLALARPIWRVTQPEPLHLVFLIDKSASMFSKYYGTGTITTRWNLMEKKIREIIDKSPTETTVSFYSTPHPRASIQLKRYESISIIEFLDPINRPSDIEALVSLAQGVKGEFYFCSDKLPPDSVIDKLSKKPYLILVGEPSDNKAIIRASATPTPNKDDYYDVFTSIKNYSLAPADIVVDLISEKVSEKEIKLGHQKINLGVGEKKDLFFKDINLPGRPHLRVTLNNEDEMSIDNNVWLMPPKKCKVSIAGKDNPALTKALKSLPSVSLNSKSEVGDISIFNETLPFSPSGKAIIINAIPGHSIGQAFWDVQGKMEQPVVIGIDTSSPILKYCDFNVFNNIPYAQKLLPKEKEYIKPIITANSASGDECVLIGEWQKGDRHLVFLNFPLEWRSQSNPTDWTLTPFFPIFWTNLINYLHPVSQDYTVDEGLCNEAESDNNGVTVLDTNVPTPEQMPRMETSRVELGHWPIIGAAVLFLLGWILAKK